MYNLRDVSREAASRCLRIPANTLDSLVHRYALGGKRGGARVFSIRDLATIKTARHLAGPDVTLAEALALCGPLLAEEPPPDAVLIVTDDGRSWMQREHDDWPEFSCRIVHTGQISQDIRSRLDVAVS